MSSNGPLDEDESELELHALSSSPTCCGVVSALSVTDSSHLQYDVLPSNLHQSFSCSLRALAPPATVMSPRTHDITLRVSLSNPFAAAHSLMNAAFLGFGSNATNRISSLCNVSRACSAIVMIVSPKCAPASTKHDPRGRLASSDASNFFVLRQRHSWSSFPLQVPFLPRPGILEVSHSILLPRTVLIFHDIGARDAADCLSRRVGQDRAEAGLEA
ncbi:hypothetical protein ACHAXT_008303 [Thalassiosira profunda]